MFFSNDRGSGSSFTPLYAAADEQPIFTSHSGLPDHVSLNSKLAHPHPLPSYHFLPSFDAEVHDHHAQPQLLVSDHLLPQQQQQQLVTANSNLITEILIDLAAVSDMKSSTMTKSHDLNASNSNYCASMAVAAEKQNLHPQQKRSVKRDRHSKITTAQGIRDRRMRLSLDVAREFFGLQDLRCDDKPSKTIRWLLNQCKGAIKELTRAKEVTTKHDCDGGGAKSTVSSTTSECEVMSSGIKENEGMVIPEKKSLTKKRKRQQPPRKTKFHPFGRESREKARARARERTRLNNSNKYIVQKMMMSSNPSETGDEESGVSHSHEMKSSMVEETTSSHLLDHLQRPNQNDNGISQGLICSNDNNNVPSYFENWEVDSTRAHYNCYRAMSNAYPSSSTGNIHDRISSSSAAFLTTSEIHLPWDVYNN